MKWLTLLDRSRAMMPTTWPEPGRRNLAGPSVAPTPSKATHTSPQKELRALRLPSTVAPTSPTLVVVAVLYPQLWLHPVVLCKCTDRTLSRGESGSACQVMAISFTFIISCTFSIRQQYFSLIINQSTLI